MQLGRLPAIVALGLLALAGCRTAPYVNSHLETVNAEYRQLEDYVYCLEDENAKLTRELEACKEGRPGVTPPERGERGGLFRRNLRGRPGSEDSPELSPPTIDPGTMEPPAIEVPDIPSETPPRRSTLNRPAGEAGETPEKLDLDPPSVELPAPESSEPTPARPAAPEPIPSTKPADTKITHLHLSPVMTGGADLDGRPGDDGLTVVIEPRNAGDEFVPEAGAVSVVVLDPSKAGEAARVARWNFAAAETREKLASSAAARGIRLQMPWPATPPASQRLHLFVRYETADGRQLQTDREIFLTPQGQVSERWTPRPVERQRPAATPPPQVAQQPKTAVPDLLTPPAWTPYR
jgi:hypothetical protein